MCIRDRQPPDLSLSASQSVGASASDGHIQMVQRYNQSRIAFPGLFSVKKKTYIYKTFPGPIHRLCGESTCIDGSSSLSDWAIWSPRFSHCGGHSSIFSLGFLNACLWNMLCRGWTECGRCTGAIICFCALLDGDETSSQRVLAVAFTVEILGNYTPVCTYLSVISIHASIYLSVCLSNYLSIY